MKTYLLGFFVGGFYLQKNIYHFNWIEGHIHKTIVLMNVISTCPDTISILNDTIHVLQTTGVL